MRLKCKIGTYFSILHCIFGFCFIDFFISKDIFLKKVSLSNFNMLVRFFFDNLQLNLFNNLSHPLFGETKINSIVQFMLHVMVLRL